MPTKFDGVSFTAQDLTRENVVLADDDEGVRPFAQGGALDEDYYWLSGTESSAEDCAVQKYDRESEEQEVNNPNLTNESGIDSDARLQTIHYFDGILYIYDRDATLYEFDAETVTFNGKTHKPVPEEELIIGEDGFQEGLERYEGKIFDEPKWFFQDKARSDSPQCYGVYMTDEDFNFEKSYTPWEDIDGFECDRDEDHAGWDGISVFDYRGYTFMLGSITMNRATNPGCDLFVYDEEDDKWVLIDGISAVKMTENSNSTPDEGFQVRRIRDAVAGVRQPFDSDIREAALVSFRVDTAIEIANGCKKTDLKGVRQSTSEGVKIANE